MKFAEVMTADELAAYIRLPKSSLYKLLRDGQVPGRKIGHHWRFQKTVIDNWLNSFSSTITEPAAAAATQSFSGNSESHDVAEHAEMVGEFDVRLTQVSSGKFNGKLNFVKTPDIMVYDERWRRKTLVQGATPEAYVMLGTNAASHRSEIQWCGTVINQQRFACSGPGAPIDFVMPDRAHDICILVKPNVLESAIGQRAFKTITENQTIDFTPTAGQRLINMLIQSIREAVEKPELLNIPFYVRSLESRLLEALSDCVGHTATAGILPSASKRIASVRDAIGYLNNMAGPLTVQDLAMAVGVSQRTLEYAFRDILETTPASYLRLHRLNAAHRELVRSGPQEATVSAIAQKWGFNHPGRFSVAYRQLFGEKPSSILYSA